MRDIAYMKRKIDEDEDMQKADVNKNTIASQVRRYFEANNIDNWIEITNGIFSFAFAVTFIIETYFNDRNPRTPHAEAPEWLNIVEIVCILILGLDYITKLFVADNRLLYFFSTQSLITYISLIPASLISF